MISRVLSFCVAIGFAGIAYSEGGGVTAFRLAIFMTIPLSCIWFSEAMGNYTGFMMSRTPITAITPGCVVGFCGWFLLGLPALLFWIAHMVSQ